jgi:thioredoxin reductase (NADPH)
MTTKTKVLIIGSGAAGYTAGIYAARANLEPILFSGEQVGGQLTITTDVENYPGFADPVQGPWLMEQMRNQALNVGTKIVDKKIVSIDTKSRPFFCVDSSGDEYLADTVIIATGASAKWLGLSSEEKFRGHGVSGCATCDGFFFKNREVAVIGGGNTAVEEAIYLTNHASKVYLIHRRDTLKAEKIMQDRLFANPKIVPLWYYAVEEFLGVEKPLKYLTGLKLKSTKNEESMELKIDGAFVAIGHKPNTDIFNGKVGMDSEGYVITTAGSTNTNVEGIFACGDVQDKKYRQAVTAAGSGCMAALDAQRFLENNH